MFGVRLIPKIPLRRIPRIPLSTTSSSSTSSASHKNPQPPETPAAAEADDAHTPMTREDAYRQIQNLDFSTATKILFTTPAKTKKFGFDFHLVQFFFVCLPSLGVYLVAQYARYKMRRMEAEAELKKKQAEEEERAKEAGLAPLEEVSSDAELSKVLVRLDALEEVVKEIVDEKRKTPNADSSKKAQEIGKNSGPQSKSKSYEHKQEQNKVAADGSIPAASSSSDDGQKIKDKGR